MSKIGASGTLINSFSIGDGYNTVKSISIDNESIPFIQYVSDKFLISDDGVITKNLSIPIASSDGYFLKSQNNSAIWLQQPDVSFSDIQTAISSANSYISFNNQEINNVSTAIPIQLTEAVNKAYVDSIVSGFIIKSPVKGLYTSSLTLSGIPADNTIDEIVGWNNGDRILLIGQSTGSQNGIWSISTGSWTRPIDFAIGSSAALNYCFVQKGTVYADTGWVCTNISGSDVVNANSLSFIQFSASGVIINGNGLNKSGEILSVLADPLGGSPTITVSSSGVKVNTGNVSHSGLANLSNDDHTQYVHNTIARTISAVHTFNPSATGAAFSLGTKSTGQLITGLNADLLDGYHASALFSSGPTGAIGAIGTTGPQGNLGPTGPAIITGTTGPQGNLGTTGFIVVGATGSLGSTGPIGSIGPTGSAQNDFMFSVAGNLNVCGGKGNSYPPSLNSGQSAVAISGSTGGSVFTTSSGDSWITNALVGQYAYSYNSSSLYSGVWSKILSNTTNTLTISGSFYSTTNSIYTALYNPISATYVPAGNTYGIMGCCFDGESIWFGADWQTYNWKLNIATGVATGFAHGQSTAGFFTTCCFDGENVWFAPNTYQTNLCKVNVATGATAAYAHGETGNASIFTGCCFDGANIWFSAANAANNVKINVATGIITKYSHGLGTNAAAFAGCCFDGTNVWFAPVNSSNILKINVTTGATAIYAHGQGTSAFSSCCFDGTNTWFAPLNSSNILKINVTTGATATYAHGQTGPFYGCCFDGANVWFAPNSSANILNINVSSNTLSTYLHGMGNNTFFGCCFDGNSIWFCPFSGTTVLRLDLPQQGRNRNYKPIIGGNAMIQGSVGIGQTSAPTARLHLPAGSTGAGTAPLKLTSGSVLTTPENGAMEYDGNHLYFTIGSTRYTISPT